ncbi:MAG: NAD-dependent epimerase/dehydratase family protein [Chloroflexi bacterium]|nr:NAD-dependent epimerase/dehydratase family protein [Chloroflexota bacterium]
MDAAVELKGKRFAVIGGAGLVGSHVVDALLNEPVEEVVVLDDFARGTRENLGEAARRERIRVVSASMAEPEVLRETLEGVDGVFLLASLWLTERLEDQRRAWSVNVLGTWNVIEACRDLGIRRVV